jgi:hypothetical protein
MRDRGYAHLLITAAAIVSLDLVARRGGHNVHHDNPDLTVSAIGHILTTSTAR